MSSTTIKYQALVKKQYQYKMKAYFSLFNSLIILQVFALLFSFSPTSSLGTGGYGIDVSFDSYSANISIIFTLLWGFISAFLITTKAYREDDYTFVTNYMTQGIANILFLATSSIIAGITAMFSGYVHYVILFFTTKLDGIYTQMTSLTDLLLGIIVTSFFVFLFCALGYFAGTLVQLHKIFVVILPGLVIGFLIINGAAENTILEKIFHFYFGEANLFIFFLKIAITVSVLFFLSLRLFKNKEVRS